MEAKFILQLPMTQLYVFPAVCTYQGAEERGTAPSLAVRKEKGRQERLHFCFYRHSTLQALVFVVRITGWAVCPVCSGEDFLYSLLEGN